MKKTIWGILTMSTAFGLFGCATNGTWSTASSDDHWRNDQFIYQDRSDKMLTSSPNYNGPATDLQGISPYNSATPAYRSGTASYDQGYSRTDVSASADSNNRSDLNSRTDYSSRTDLNNHSDMSMNNRSDLNSRTDMNTRSDLNNNSVASNTNTSGMNANENTGAGPQLNDGSDKTKIAAALSELDQKFIQDVGAGGMYEVQAGQKAVAKSSDQKIKDLAQHMVDDHTKANQQLMALARRKGVELAAVPNADQVKMLAQLDKLNGSDFDQEYINQQRTAHQETIAKFEQEANNGKDRDTRDWAASTLPTLREHLKMINNEPSTGLGSEH